MNWRYGNQYSMLTYQLRLGGIINQYDYLERQFGSVCQNFIKQCTPPPIYDDSAL